MFLSLKGVCTGSSESTVVKMPHYLKSRVTAQMMSLTYKEFADSGPYHLSAENDNKIFERKIAHQF